MNNLVLIVIGGLLYQHVYLI